MDKNPVGGLLVAIAVLSSTASLPGCGKDEATGKFGDATLAAYDTSLAAYWKLDETTGSTWADSIASTSLTSMAANSSTSITSATGISGSAASLTRASFHYGTNASVASTVAPASSMVVSAWIYSGAFPTTSNVGDDFFVIRGLNSGGTQVFSLYVTSAGVKFQLAASVSAAVGAIPSNSAWHHVVGIAAGSSVDLYVDGVKGTSLSGAVSFSNVVSSIQIGGKNNGYNFNGRLDEIALWKDVTFADSSAQQAFVTALYNGGAGKFIQ